MNESITRITYYDHCTGNIVDAYAETPEAASSRIEDCEATPETSLVEIVEFDVADLSLASQAVLRVISGMTEGCIEAEAAIGSDEPFVMIDSIVAGT